MSSWVLRATGDLVEGAEHSKLLEELRDLLGHPGAGTRTTEFVSANGVDRDFHQAPAETAQPPQADPPGGGDQAPASSTGEGAAEPQP